MKTLIRKDVDLVKLNISIKKRTDNQIAELCFFYNSKSSHTVSTILEEFLKSDKLKKEFTEYKKKWEKLVSYEDYEKKKKGITKTSMQATYMVPAEVANEFDNNIFKFRFFERSVFFRAVISFFYDKFISDVKEDMEKISKALEKIGYEIKKTGPMDEDIMILIKNPKKK